VDAGQVDEPGVPPVSGHVAVPVCGSTPQWGRPRRVSSMPSSVTGSGWAGSSAVALPRERGRQGRPAQPVVPPGLRDRPAA
jgi:hypothetical protein